MSRWNRGWKRFLAAAILSAAVAVGTPGAMLAADAATVTADVVNVRNEPSTEGDNVIGSLSEGDEVTILNSQEADDGTWYYVQLDNGNTGWVRSDLVSADESELSFGSESSDSSDADSQENQSDTTQAQEDSQTPEGTAESSDTSSTQEASETAAGSGETSAEAVSSSDPTTDPNSSFSTQFLTGDDGISCWYVVNDSTGERIKISDLQNGSAATAVHSGSGWRVFAIIMLLIAIALAAFALFLLRSIRGGRSKSTHGRAVEAEEDEDDFADDDEYYFEDDDDEEENISDVKNVLREDEEDIPAVDDDDSDKEEPLYEETPDMTSDNEDGSGENANAVRKGPAVEHITDAEEIPADETPDLRNVPQDPEPEVYTEEETENDDYDSEEDYPDEEDYDEEDTESETSGKGGGFKRFVRRILGTDSSEDSEDQDYDDESIEDDDEEFDEFKEYPEDVDLLPKENRDKTNADFAEDVTFDDDEIAEDYNNDRTHLFMQRVMKKVSAEDEDEIPQDDSDEGEKPDSPEDDLFDDDDDDMEYSFLGTRHRK